ncbi:hypothetical protein ACJDT4_00310 [Clostridium neuense]|uniref:Uncharacterized protein n=1 Tax=Clostridium neuense TaxID=1728934 RepID=A0ABW8T8Z3_9CLOT
MVSNNILMIIATIGATFGVVGTVIGAIPYLTKKGINVQSTISNVDKGLTASDGVLSVASELLPSNPIVNALKIVDKYAHVGVNQAEQLYLTSQFPVDQRNAKAKETIYAALTAANIVVTPEIEKIIDGAIETEVLALGHKLPTEAEKAAQFENIQKENSKLVQENQTLNEKLANIAAQTK